MKLKWKSKTPSQIFPTPYLTCDRCLIIADFYIAIVRQLGTDGEPLTELWCPSCISGET